MEHAAVSCRRRAPTARTRRRALAVPVEAASTFDLGRAGEEDNTTPSTTPTCTSIGRRRHIAQLFPSPPRSAEKSRDTTAPSYRLYPPPPRPPKKGNIFYSTHRRQAPRPFIDEGAATYLVGAPGSDHRRTARSKIHGSRAQIPARKLGTHSGHDVRLVIVGSNIR
jgi:hypothetical protein